MNKSKLFIPELLEPRRLLSGSAWSTVDDYNLSAGKTAATYAMATDSTGNVFAAGFATDSSGHQHGIVREKTAGSNTWSTIVNYAYAAGTDTEFAGISSAPNGTLYLSGWGMRTDAGAARHHWITVAVAPAGSPTLVDDFVPQAGMDTYATANAIDAAGNVFVAGYAPVAIDRKSTVIEWFVREKAAGAGSFVTVDAYTKSGSTTNQASGITIVPSGPSAGIYVAGVTFGSTVDWIVRKSVNGGASWGTVDDYTYQAGSGTAHAITADSAGNLYVTGIGISHSSSAYHWLVRESSNGGATWTVVDDWRYSSSTYSIPYGIGVDAQGNVNVVGNAQDAGGFGHAILRNNAGGAWQVADDYQLAAGKAATFRTFATDIFGTSYTAGAAVDAAGNTHWIVRNPPVSMAAFSSSPITSVLATQDLSSDTSGSSLVIDRRWAI